VLLFPNTPAQTAMAGTAHLSQRDAPAARDDWPTPGARITPRHPLRTCPHRMRSGLRRTTIAWAHVEHQQQPGRRETAPIRGWSA
jgi:hypothetical protein